MTAEITSEDVVTELLTSNEIIMPQKGKFHISNPKLETLSDFLLDIKEEYVPPKIEIENTKYIFIKQKKTP